MFWYYSYTTFGEHIHSCLLKLQFLNYIIKVYQAPVNTVVVRLHILGPYWCMHYFQTFLQCHVHMNIFKNQHLRGLLEKYPTVFFYANT
jgi:hypothetical protein